MSRDPFKEPMTYRERHVLSLKIASGMIVVLGFLVWLFA